MACQAPICWSKYTTIVIAEKEIPLILLTKKCILQFTVLTGPYKTTLIASLHLQLRSATIDDAAIDNAAKKCLLRHRKTCQLKNCKNLLTHDQAVLVYVFITLCTLERDLRFPPSLLPR